VRRKGDEDPRSDGEELSSLLALYEPLHLEEG
jgi:hypothetical protein